MTLVPNTTARAPMIVALATASNQIFRLESLILILWIRCPAARFARPSVTRTPLGLDCSAALNTFVVSNEVGPFGIAGSKNIQNLLSYSSSADGDCSAFKEDLSRRHAMFIFITGPFRKCWFGFRQNTPETSAGSRWSSERLGRDWEKY